MASTESTLVRNKLTDFKSWPNWLTQLKAECYINGVWDQVNPDAPNTTLAALGAPAQPIGIDQMLAELNAKRAAERALQPRTTRSSGSASTPDLPDPPPVPATFEDIQPLFTARQAEYTRLHRAHVENTTVAKAIHKWLVDTVDQDVMELARSEAIVASGDKPFTPQAIVRILKAHIAPSNSSVVSDVRNAYARAINTASIPRTDARRFYKDWYSAYQKGVNYKIPEVVEPMAAQDFLKAAEKYAPEWSRAQQNQMTENEVTDTPTKDATHFGRVFTNLLDKQESEPRKPRGQNSVFATFGQRSDSPSKDYHECPCKMRKHHWKPVSCRKLQAAAMNAPDDYNSAFDIAKTRSKMFGGKWAEVIRAMKNNGVVFAPNTSNASSFSKNKHGPSNPKLAPTGFNACVIDMSLLETEEIMGVYATALPLTRHPLADSTLVDNCGAMHLVNSKALLVPGSFVKSSSYDMVQTGTTSLPVVGRGKRVI